MMTPIFLIAAASMAIAPAASAVPGDARARVGKANAEARVEPGEHGYRSAIEQYAWAEGALYQVYAAPGQVTDIALEPGEALVGPGPVAAGDTVRWIIGDTVSGAGPSRRVHLLVKPTRPDISTNLVINTDRRTYHLELRATPAIYMASVSWTYPADALIALRAGPADEERTAPVASAIDPAALDFRYRIAGDKVGWRPLRVFADGRQTFVEFPAGIASEEMPPIFLLNESGEAELVNYRVSGRYMIVDRLFDRAVMRLGVGKAAREVRITRDKPRRDGR